MGNGCAAFGHEFGCDVVAVVLFVEGPVLVAVGYGDAACTGMGEECVEERMTKRTPNERTVPATNTNTNRYKPGQPPGDDHLHLDRSVVRS